MKFALLQLSQALTDALYATQTNTLTAQIHDDVNRAGECVKSVEATNWEAQTQIIIDIMTKIDQATYDTFVN